MLNACVSNLETFSIPSMFLPSNGAIRPSISSLQNGTILLRDLLRSTWKQAQTGSHLTQLFGSTSSHPCWQQGCVASLQPSDASFLESDWQHQALGIRRGLMYHSTELPPWGVEIKIPHPHKEKWQWLNRSQQIGKKVGSWLKAAILTSRCYELWVIQRRHELTLSKQTVSRPITTIGSCIKIKHRDACMRAVSQRNLLESVHYISMRRHRNQLSTTA